MVSGTVIIVAAIENGVTLGSLAPRKVNLELKRIFKKEIDIRLIQARSKWLVKCSSLEELSKWKNIEKFLGVKIQVTESQNLKVGVISSPSLVNETDNDILEDLKVQGVVKLRNFPSKNKTRGPTFAIYFMNDVLPNEVKIGYESFRVRQYEADPLRCYNCNKFGHTAKNCKQKEKSCINCGKFHEITTGTKCTERSFCTNCGSRDHNVLSRNCRSYIKEKEIISYASKVKDSVGLIKEKLKSGFQIPQTFSQVVKVPTTTEVSTQTDIFENCHFPAISLLPSKGTQTMPLKISSGTQTSESDSDQDTSSSEESDASMPEHFEFPSNVAQEIDKLTEFIGMRKIEGKPVYKEEVEDSLKRLGMLEKVRFKTVFVDENQKKEEFDLWSPKNSKEKKKGKKAT